MLILFWLLVGHALADFALQSEWMAKAKNRNSGTTLSYIPPGQTPQIVWPFVLSAHALIHGGVVAVATGIWWLGALETGAHWAIDFGKCENHYGIYADQALHVGCKVLWLFLAVRASG